MSSAPTIPAIVPAAGESRRMGRPKLLVEIHGRPLIGHVVAALRDGGADPVIVIAPPEQSSEGPPIHAEALSQGARVVAPSIRPPRMRESVELGLVEAARRGPPDAVTLTPADSPALSAQVVSRVISAWRRDADRIQVACVQGRRAHPIVIPWRLASRIPELPPDQGVNGLLKAFANFVSEIEIEGPELLADFNTPEDLDRWVQGHASVVSVRLFAVARERAGGPEIAVRLPLPATVAALRKAIAQQYPALAELAARVLIAVDAEYASDETLVTKDSKLAIIPPVSGG